MSKNNFQNDKRFLNDKDIKFVNEKDIKNQILDRPKAPAMKARIDGQGRLCATGKRKTSVARIMYDRKGKHQIIINGKDLRDYFPENKVRTLQNFLVISKIEGNIVCNVHGGGMTGQCEAIRHGIASAAAFGNEELRKVLKPLGFLTRDNRIVERKKPGRKKARRSFQFVKR